MASATRSSACPHDCPSTCALEVEIIDGARIGAVHGAGRQQLHGRGDLRQGRALRRAHPPSGPTHPAAAAHRPEGQRAVPTRSAGTRRSTGSPSVSPHRPACTGPEAVWPYYFAGTMGLVQRDGINRLRHVMRYSRQSNTICIASVCEVGWIAGVGRFTGPDPREMAKSDLIVVWGGNPVDTQVNVMTHITPGAEGARREAGRRRSLPHRHGGGRRHAPRACARAPTAALACAVMHVAFRDGYADRAYMPTTPMSRRSWRRISPPAGRNGRPPSPASRSPRSRRSPGSTARPSGPTSASATASRACATAPRNCTRSPACRRSPASGQHEGGGAFWNNRGIYHWDKTLIEGLDARDHGTAQMDMSRIGAVLTGDRARRSATARRCTRMLDPEHQPGHGGARLATGCAAASCATTCSSACTSSS